MSANGKALQEMFDRLRRVSPGVTRQQCEDTALLLETMRENAEYARAASHSLPLRDAVAEEDWTIHWAQIVLAGKDAG